MAANKECCFIGRGEAYVSDATGVCGWGTQWGLDWGGSDQAATYIGRSVGNVSSLSITPNTSTVQNVTRAGLINNPDCSTVIVNGFDVEMTFSCLSRENLMMAMYGSTTTFPCTNEVIQECIAAPQDTGFECDSVVQLKSPNFDPATLVVTDLATNLPLVEGVDYTVTNFGIKFIKAFLNNAVFQLDYELTADSFSCLELFTECPKPVRITFDGFNLADKNECFYVELYNVLFSPSGLNFITDDFQEITLTGVLEPNDTITSNALSKYARICYRDKG